MKVIRFLAAHWGDIAYFLLCPICGQVSFLFRSRLGQCSEWPAYALFAIFVIYTVFALARLIRLRKRCALRNWAYLFYGFFSALGTFLLILSTFSFSYVTRAHNTLALTFYFAIGVSLARIIARLIKRWKRAIKGSRYEG